MLFPWLLALLPLLLPLQPIVQGGSAAAGQQPFGGLLEEWNEIVTSAKANTPHEAPTDMGSASFRDEAALDPFTEAPAPRNPPGDLQRPGKKASSSPIDQRKSRWKHLSVALLLAASAVGLSFGLPYFVGKAPEEAPGLPDAEIPSLVPEDAKPPAEIDPVLYEATKYARELDIGALQLLSSASQSIGLAFGYPGAVSEAALLIRHCHSVERESAALMQLHERVRDGNITREEALQYAEQSQSNLEEQVGIILDISRRFQAHGLKITAAKIAEAAKCLASLKEHRENSMLVSADDRPPYVRLAQFILSSCCTAVEQDAKRLHQIYLKIEEEQKHMPRDLTEAGAAMQATAARARRVASVIHRIRNLEAMGTEGFELLQQGLHVCGALDASAAVRSLKPRLCKLRIKQAIAQTAIERLTKEQEAKLEACGHDIHYLYWELEDLELVLSVLKKHSSPSGLFEFPETIRRAKDDIESKLQQLEAGMQALMKDIDVTPAEAMKANEQVLLLHHAETRSALEAVRFLSKVGNYWSREHDAGLMNRRHVTPNRISLLHGKKGSDVARNMDMEKSQAEQEFKEFGRKTKLPAAIAIFEEVLRCQAFAEGAVQQVITSVTTACMAELLERSVHESKTSMLESLTLINTKLEQANKPVLDVSDNSRFSRLVEAFDKTEDLMGEGRIALELQQMARHLTVIREDFDMEEVLAVAAKYLTSETGVADQRDLTRDGAKEQGTT